MEPLVILNSKRKYVRHLVSVTVFLAIDVYMIAHTYTTGEQWIGWTGLVFFGSLIVVFSRELLDSRPRIIINEMGIEDRKLGVGLIPWSEITGAYVKSFKGADFICLLLRNPEMWTHKLSPAAQKMGKANRALGFSDLNLILSGTDANSTRVLDLIVKFIAARY
jgi:hypothetical protein